MEVYISDQCLQFLLCALLGAFAGLMYEFPRILRKMKRHNMIFVIIEDVLFCLTFSFVFISIAYTVSDGIVRWYYYAGVFLGFTIYWLSFGRFIRHMTPMLIDRVRKFTSFIRKKCFHPLAKSTNTVIIFLKNIFRKIIPQRRVKSKRKIQDSPSKNERYF